MKKWKSKSLVGLLLGLLCCVSLIGCAASTKNIGSITLPTSGRTIDVVQHRAEIDGCLDFKVLQTYDSEGKLIDSQRGYGNTLPCVIIGAAIETGGYVGAASIAAHAASKAASTASNIVNVTAGATSTSTGGSNGGSNGGGGEGGSGHGHGNNGFGNGGGDGSPNGHNDGNR
jgi:uncharacterized membrane protein YgcG